jgi:gamma-D-glutamyl-L-lysine dipeptidyl-peptidase
VSDRLERDLSDVQRKWVPDHRLGVLEIVLTSGDGAAVPARLSGATTSREALAALQRLGAGAGITLDVSLLPLPAMAREPVALVVAALAPLLAAPSLTAPRVSEALHGEPLDVLERRGEWLRVRAADGYHAWTHAGYLTLGPPEWAEDWATRAGGRAVSAELRDGDTRLRLPIGARVMLRGDERVETADGRRWTVIAGAVRREVEWRTEAGFVAPPEWALRWYSGAPYLLGGRSDWGIDCSGLVQATYAARGRLLPRDSDLQSLAGREVPISADGAAYEAGDILCFAEQGRVSHAALWAGAGRIVHASLARGGVASDDLFGEAPAMRRLHAGLVAVRRVRESVATLRP